MAWEWAAVAQCRANRQRAQSGYGREGEKDRYRPYQGLGGGAGSDDSEDEWSTRSKKRRRQSSASIAGRASKRSSIHQLEAADPPPSSSPFRAVRPAWKKHSRTAGGGKKYGSKRGRLADPATPEDDAERRPTRRVRGPELGTGEERAGIEEWTAHLREYARPGTSSASTYSASTPPLSSESIHRTTAVLRAYTNILDSTIDSSSPCSAFRLSTLAESSARAVGWAIEENVRGWLVENGMVSPEPSSDTSSDDGSSGSEDSDGDSLGPTSVGMDRVEGVSAQEAEIQASRLVDEWYEAFPTYTWRWILAEHATSILVAELQDAEAPYGIWETILGVCVERRAYSEAARLHRPLVQSAFTLPPTTASSPLLLDVLRLTPSPHALLHTALLPTLLSSAFEDRFFFHTFLTLSPSKLGTASEAAIQVLSVLGEVAGKMVSTLQELRDEEEDDEEDEGLGEMVDEVLARMVKQVKAALPLLLEFPPDSHLSYREIGLERRQRFSRLEQLSEMIYAVLDATGGRLANEDAEGPASELVALALVTELEAVTIGELHLRPSLPNLDRLDRLLALPPAVTLLSPSSPDPTSDTDSSDDTDSCLLVDYLSTYYLASRSRKTKIVDWHTSRTIDNIVFLLQEVLCVSDSNDIRQRRRDDFARCIMLACRRCRLLDPTEVQLIEGWLVKLERRRGGKERLRQLAKSPSIEEEGEEAEAGVLTDYEETPAPSAPPKRLRKRTSRHTSHKQRGRTIGSPSIELVDDSADADSDVEVVEPAFSLSRPVRQLVRADSTASFASSRIPTREGSVGSVSKRRPAAHAKPVEIVVLEPSPSPDLPSPPPPISRSSTSSTASSDQQSRLKPPRARSPDADATPTSSEPDDLDLLRSARRRPSRRPPPMRDDRASAPSAPKPRSGGKAPPSPTPSPPVQKRRRLEDSDRAALTDTTGPSQTDLGRPRMDAKGFGVKRRRVMIEDSSEDELAL